MKRTDQHSELSRRERQIMDIVYRLGEVTPRRSWRTPDPPATRPCGRCSGCSRRRGTSRTSNRVPVTSSATVPVESARRSALRRLLQTFFDNSLEEAVATLLDVESSNVTEEELDRLAQMIDQARKEGR